MSKIRLYHLEDYKIMRDGIKFLLAHDEQIEMVGGGKQAEELFEVLEKSKIDVVLLDIYLDRMGDLKTMNGFEICHILKEKYPDVKVVAHSVYDDADKVARIMKEGALGFVSKKTGYEELVKAIKTVYAGEKYICEETAKSLTNLNKFLAGIEDTLKSKKEFFSKREREILELMAKGYSNRDIAETLFITEKTVESHRKNMVDKAKMKNSVELIAFATARGIIKK
ncbi:response regulator transcription factor [Ohtaekwangia sp.]|uniref:response regulator transcription factor n=1 Tax=Ohtaekwangia sp. TaxID=2066019 RepID=UPI002F93D308